MHICLVHSKSGSDKIENNVCNLEHIVMAGDQSSLKKHGQKLPSVLKLGWYIFVLRENLGGLNG